MVTGYPWLLVTLKTGYDRATLTWILRHFSYFSLFLFLIIVLRAKFTFMSYKRLLNNDKKDGEKTRNAFGTISEKRLSFSKQPLLCFGAFSLW